MSAYQKLVMDDCANCKLRGSSDFCNLPGDSLRKLSSLGNTTIFPSGAVLIAEGAIPPGVFILCSGRAKLSMIAEDGRNVILTIPAERQVLGLSAVILGGPSPVTATTIETCQVMFVRSDAFRAFLSDGEAAVRCGVELGRESQKAFRDVHELLFARSSTEKLARLFLSWGANVGGNRDVRLPADFTHEEIAQMIGSSRETVTRLMSDMKRKELIRLEGSTLVIPDRIALQAMVF